MRDDAVQAVGREALEPKGERSRAGRTDRALAAVYGLLTLLVLVAGGQAALGLLAGGGAALIVGAGLRLRPSSSRLPWLALAVPLLAIPEMLLGTPSPARAMLGPIIGVVMLFTLRWLEGVVSPVAPRRWDLLVAAGMVVYVLIAWAAISHRYIHFGDREISQDTAYFEQLLWGYVNGRNWFMGSSQAWWKYDPPLTTHFAMHFSPILYPIAWLYRLWPSYHLLHLLQIVGITAAAIPVYGLVRGIDARAGALFCLAYLAHAAVLSQTQVAFHELAFAAPVVAFAIWFFVRQRLGWFLLTLVAGLMVREDLALVAVMAGALAPLVHDGRRHWAAWTIAPVLIGVFGWAGIGLVMTAWGKSGGQVIAGMFSRFGQTYPEIVLGMISRPGEVIDLVLEGHRPKYLLGLLRPGLVASLLSPLSLLVAPALAINLLVRGAGTAWLHVHYSVYLPAALIPAAVLVWVRWAPWIGAALEARPAAVRSGLAAVMVSLSVLGLPEVFDQAMFKSYLPQDDEDEVRAIVASIPPDASVAAPRFMLHAMAKRERLYMVNRWALYTIYDPEYVVVDRDFRRVRLNDGSVPAYAAYAAFLAVDPGFREVTRYPHYVVYRRRPGAAPVPQEISNFRSPADLDLQDTSDFPMGGEGIPAPDEALE